eukprot:scaffold73865_cov63-Phaeocystis_antarctica.AAC.3
MPPLPIPRAVTCGVSPVSSCLDRGEFATCTSASTCNCRTDKSALPPRETKACGRTSAVVVSCDSRHTCAHTRTTKK